MDFENVIKSRFSVRSFSNKKIEKEKLDRILEAGRIAPTAMNLQPQRIYVLTSEESFEKLGPLGCRKFNAPIILMICSDIESAWHSKYEKGYTSVEMDASIVATHMMLEATNLGLGSVWVRNFNSKELQKAFDLNNNIIPICLLPIGYKSDDCVPNEEKHNFRKDIKEEVEYL